MVQKVNLEMTDGVQEELDKRTIYVGSVAELEGLSLAEGVNVYLTQEGRAGEFVVKTGTPPSDPQKGIYIVLANGNYAERVIERAVYAEWFGAKGDGSDSTTAISAALSLSSVVSLGTGDFMLSSTVQLKDGNVLVGNGELNTRIFRDTSVPNFDYFEGVSVDGVGFIGISFDGVEKLPVTIADNRRSAIRLWDNGTGVRSKNATILHCKFSSFTSAEVQPEGNRGVITVEPCDDVLIRGCKFYDNRATCVFYLDDSKNIRVDGNYCLGEQEPYDLNFQPNQGLGSFVSGGSEGCSIVNNRIDTTGYSSINCGGIGTVVSNNVIKAPFYSGITVNERAANETRNLIISNNVISDSGLSGISVFDVDGFVITGNFVTNAQTTSNGQIRLYPTADGLGHPKNGLITNNLFSQTDANNPGIRVNAASDVAIAGNNFNKTVVGVFVSAQDAGIPINISITGNTFEDCVNFGVELNNGAVANQIAYIDNNTFISSNIATVQKTAIVSTGSLSTAYLGDNTFSPNYNTDYIETDFANRDGKALLISSSGVMERMRVVESINYIRTTTFDPVSLLDGARTSGTISVPGALVGDLVQLSFSQPLQGIQLFGEVSSTGTVTFVFFNNTGATVDLASGTVRAKVVK